jgi:hypothetical protein
MIGLQNVHWLVVEKRLVSETTLVAPFYKNKLEPVSVHPSPGVGYYPN